MGLKKKDERWQWKIRRHQIRFDEQCEKSSGVGYMKSNLKNIDNLSVNVYVTNFPDTVTVNDL